MSLPQVIAAVHRWRAQVQVQAQLARDIWHLRESARMLIEDNPDKTKAVAALHAIAAQKLLAMGAEARGLLESLPAVTSDGVVHDPGVRLGWLMCVNPSGRIPYTQGTRAPGDPAEARTTPLLLQNADNPQTLAAALNAGWDWLSGAQAAGEAVALRALQFAIAFDEHRDAEHRALSAAARRLWAVSLREFFGVRGEGLKLWLIAPAVPPRPDGSPHFDGQATDRAEDALLAALALPVRSAVVE